MFPLEGREQRTLTLGLTVFFQDVALHAPSFSFCGSKALRQRNRSLGEDHRGGQQSRPHTEVHEHH